MNTRTPLDFGNYYHIYNHANGDIQLFRNEENYRYFLSRYEKYVHPLVDTLSYCLLPNHFHFLIKVKEQVDLPEVMLKNSASNSIISNSIKNWLLSYTQAYNRAYNTKGNLYHQKIRRKEIADEKYIQSLVAYINLNPIHHNFVSKPEKWRYSSYQALISDKKTLINRKLVFAFFDDLENLKYFLDSKRLDYILEQVNLEY